MCLPQASASWSCLVARWESLAHRAGTMQKSEHSGSALGNGGTIPWPWHRCQNLAVVSPWGSGGACGAQPEPVQG